MLGSLDQRQLLLATLPPSQRHIWAALGAVVALLVGFVVTVPFAGTPLPRVDAIIPIIAITTLINDLITSVLLFSQYCIVQRRALLVLASGYLFSSLIVIPWVLTYPRVFAPTGLLGAGLQTTAWLYTFWHVGAPLVLIIAVLLKTSENKPSESQRSPAAAIGLSIAVVAATVCGLTWIAVAGDRFLPKIMLPDGVRANASVALLAGGLTVALAGCALALLWIRRRSVLDIWLMVVCFAWMFEGMTSFVLVGARFSLGFYVGRIFGIVATFVVLLVLLSETFVLYANLARSIIRQRSDRQTRQIAMDAMAASIVHEIKQPLSAIVTNANAGLRWLNRTAPDLDKARDSFTRIVNNGNRLDKIVGSTRSMFKKGAHGQVLLDVNDLVRETLTMIDLDLQTQRVTVTTDLRNGLPKLTGDRG